VDFLCCGDTLFNTLDAIGDPKFSGGQSYCLKGRILQRFFFMSPGSDFCTGGLLEVLQTFFFNFTWEFTAVLPQ
jgi:hypothetical protein